MAPQNTNPVPVISGNLTRQLVDDFIYRSAHDLRGPLATILGLVNLLRMRKDESEVDRFVDLIDAHARKLDERLHQLVYLAQSDDHSESPSNEIDAALLETHVRKIIEKNSFVDFLELSVTCPEMVITDFNEILLKSLLANAILHVLTLDKSGTCCTIDIHIHASQDFLDVIIESKGFFSDPDFHTDIEENAVRVYGELLQSSKFTYFYAAKKIAAQLQAVMEIQKVDSAEERIVFRIPKLSAINHAA
jgi:light-regulated signal transduction histidine kinase (bacteriophytochrome)